MVLIYNSISSAFAPGKGLTTNKSSLVDNSQTLTFFNYGVPNNHCNTTTLFISLFCLAFMLLLIFFMSLFRRFTCHDDMLAVTLDNLSLLFWHPFVSFSSEPLRTWYLFWIIFISLSIVLLLFLNEYLLGVSNWFFERYFYDYISTFYKKNYRY